MVTRNNRNRQPKGTSKGGQFAPETHEAAPTDLDVSGNEAEATLVERYPNNGNLKREEWRDKNGDLDRVDGPAFIVYFENGTIEEEQWWRNGKFHRDDGPAYTGYYPDGTIRTESWWKDGELHRDNAPAGIIYNEDGTIGEEHWWQDDELHRADGPARIFYSQDGDIEREQWWQYGEKIAPPDQQKR